MDLSKLNWVAVLAAAAMAFVVGGMWYSPMLFGGVWMRETGLTDDALRRRKMAKVFSGSFVLSLLIALNLAAFLSGGPPNLLWGMAAGALAGVGWVATSMGITYLFELRSMKLFLVNAGYHAVTFVLMGGILGVWK
jgi:hypothetical protein